jgi:tetratricopeptide (TPR) repeat protein
MRTIAAVLLLACSTAAYAQGAGCHDDGPMVGWVPSSLIERPVALREGIGFAHEQVSTASKDAQAFYDQGLAYLHSYVFIEAARSFHQALRHDPKLAMAYVGLSRAYTGFFDYEAASAAMAKAVELSDGVTDRERVRIDLRVLQLSSIKDPKNAEKLAAYKSRLDDALAKHVADEELWIMRALVEDRLGAAGQGQYGNVLSIAYYDRVLALNPDHFGAHHYLIHSYEQVGRMEEALRHGAKYVAYAPNVAHAHHMYGHDLRRVGRTKDAIAQFETAYNQELAYFAAEKLQPEMDWHHPHNLDLLATSYQHEGQMKRAAELMTRSRALTPVTEYQAMNKKEWPAFLLSRGRVDEARAAAVEMTKSKYAGARTLGYVFTGHADLAKDAIDEAKSALASADKSLGEIDGLRADATRNAARAYVEKLRGAILLRGEEKAKGREILKAAANRLRALPGPDAWSQALFELESIAALARAANDWDLAAFAAKQMLDHDAAYGGTHYALAMVARHNGDAAAAERHLGEMAKHWASADRDLPELGAVVVQNKVAAR